MKLAIGGVLCLLGADLGADSHAVIGWEQPVGKCHDGFRAEAWGLSQLHSWQLEVCKMHSHGCHIYGSP